MSSFQLLFLSVGDISKISKKLSGALESRIILRKKFVVCIAPEEGLYSYFHRVINSNSENFLS